ncbi:MAG: peptidylprolyl isomerase, partial [Planctomycetota bacterium]
PAYPAGVREAARTLGVGEVSGPIMLEGGVVLVKLDSIDQRAAPSLETVRAEVEQNARLRQERVLMDSLARELIASIEVRFLDSSLRWSWEQRRERASDR